MRSLPLIRPLVLLALASLTVACSTSPRREVAGAPLTFIVVHLSP